MRYNFRIRKDEYIDDYDDYVVDMKCLNCDYEENIPLDILSSFFDPSVDENPALTCPHCDQDLFVPKDIYDQIKGNFVYKVDK